MGYIEMGLIFVLAFIIIGPKDFPRLMFRVGQFFAHLKEASAQFYTHFDHSTQEDNDDDTKRLT